ncbi:hypothetical protein BC830DRAFT_884728 [Chytriomyces sp. MP71]|nr:hypothetical protein BC830DRAFT_884728 [Chytriomyces sp. MP71]
MATWQAPADGAWTFQLLGPQTKVAAGEAWYFRATGSINGDAGLNPDAATIKAMNAGASSGKPGTGGSNGSVVVHTVAVGTGTATVTLLVSATSLATTTTSASTSRLESPVPIDIGGGGPAWRMPVIVGGLLAGFVLLFFVGSFFYTKLRKGGDEADTLLDRSEGKPYTYIPGSTLPFQKKVEDVESTALQQQRSNNYNYSQSNVSSSSNSMSLASGMQQPYQSIPSNEYQYVPPSQLNRDPRLSYASTSYQESIIGAYGSPQQVPQQMYYAPMQPPSNQPFMPSQTNSPQHQTRSLLAANQGKLVMGPGSPRDADC